MNQTADVIVVGCGGFGAASLFCLVERGVSVIGIDQYQPPHHQGSSHGETRIIRKAYFEHPNYVPLLLRAYELWHELATTQSTDLYVPSGLLLFGPDNGEVVAGATQSALQHGLSLETIPTDTLKVQYPQFHIPDDFVCVFEAQAGYLKVERCVEAYLNAAVESGQRLGKPPQILTNHRVISVRGAAGHVDVTLDDGTRLSAGALVMCAGAWTGQLLPDYARWITLKRKMQFWYPVQSDAKELWASSSAYLFDLPDGCFYGFPSTDGRTIKVCEHSGGLSIQHPSDSQQSVSEAERKPVNEFVRRTLRGVEDHVARSLPCIYSMSPDGHFLLDQLPDLSMVVAAGFSGHGFKFTSVIGEAIADLITTGRSTLPIEFLSRSRLGA